MKRIVSILLMIVLLFTMVPVASASQSKLVALTFDDGPGVYTERLLDGLEVKGVKATFFCLGSCAQLYPDTVRRIVADGHQLANHSYGHPNLNELTVDGAVWQITRTNDILNEITGGSEYYHIRPPYGNTTAAIRSRLEAPVFIWSVDTIDWQVRNAEKVKNNILNQTFDGSIVLMHDIHAFTVDGILAALDTLIARGYEFVTLKELYRRRGVSLPAGQQQYSCKPNGTDCGPLDAPELMVQRYEESMELSFESPDGAPVYYTLDGSDITYNSMLYTEPVIVDLPCTVRAVAAWDLNGDRGTEIQKEYTLPPAGEPAVWVEDGTVVFEAASDEEEVYVCAGRRAYPWREVEIAPDTWFTYYADGEGLTPTEPRTLLFTAQGNLVTDIQPTDWYYTAMDHGAARGFFDGKVLDPTGIVTRGMLAELLFRYDGMNVSEIDMPFTDVAEDAYYAEAVKWAFENEIINGVGNDRYDPDRPVSRQEMAKIFTIYLGLEPGAPVEYKDQAQIAAWAEDYVRAVTNHGLMQGSGGSFRPNGTATRAEIATILMRLDEE